jgi:eukaryotic-like serine/threonine-protein kinase
MICLHCKTDNESRARVCRVCARDLGVLALAPGVLIAGRYELRERLGAGGMGVVWSALDRKLEEEVALKFLNPPSGASSGNSMADVMRRRFHEEVRVARKVSHNNVCRIHDYGEDGELAFISMERLEGRDLKRWLRAEGRVQWEHAYPVLEQIGEGLAAIHDTGVVHRDLKPANIMRGRSGRVKLMDFGIAKAVSDDEGITQSGLLVGSPEYMSPEQVRGEPTPLDARSDVYAFGVVVYEMLTGRVPFPAKNALEAALRHLHDEPPLNAGEAEPIPGPVIPVLRCALAKERDGRYASAREMLKALAQARSEHASPRADRRAVPERTEQDDPAQEPTYHHPPEAALLVPALVSAARHPEARIRADAATRLGRIGGEAAQTVLTSLEEDEDEQVRAVANAARRRFAALDPSSLATLSRVAPDGSQGSVSTSDTSRVDSLGQRAIPAPPRVRAPAPPYRAWLMVLIGCVVVLIAVLVVVRARQDETAGVVAAPSASSSSATLPPSPREAP